MRQSNLEGSKAGEVSEPGRELITEVGEGAREGERLGS